MTNNYEFKTKPYAHQLKIWEETKDKDVWALFMEMGCVDSETEYLSPQGWRKISDYDGGKVAQFHLNGQADFVQPEAYVKKPCDTFYHFKHSRGLDQVLSRGHRILALAHEAYFKAYHKDSSYKQDHHWIETTPEDVARIGRQYANIQIETTFHLDDNPGGLGLTQAQLRVQVAFHADGCLGPMRVKTKDYLGTIRLKKERKKIRLEQLLNEANIWYNRHDYTEGSSAGYSVFRFVPPTFTKTFESWWGKVSYQDKLTIADECQHWDGSQRKAGAFTFGSVCDNDLDFIQYCLVSTGRRASKGTFEVNAVGCGRSTNIVQLNCEPEIGPSGDGFMYCFNVPSSYLVLRRNGCVFVTGNTGKSWIAINTFGYLFNLGRIDAVVVMAKKGEYANWSRYEIPAHLPDFIKREVLLFQGAKAASASHRDAFKSLIRNDPKRLPILVINVESLIHGGKKALEAFYRAHPRVMLVMDESTCVKHYDSKRSKESYFWAAKSKPKRIMTGTVVTQAPMDLWGQCMILAKGILGYTSYFSFRNTYCKMTTEYLGSRSFQKIVGYQHLEDLAKRVKLFSTQVLKEDCLDLPPKIYTQRVVPLTPKQEVIYNQLRDEAMLELEGHELEVVNVLAMIVKLHQIVCGQLKVGDDEYISIENDRLETLVELLEDFNGKAIIWATYRQTIVDVIKLLQEKFGRESTVGYWGGVEDKERAENVEAFKHGKARFIVANPAMGFGNTWTEATLVIYYSNSYNLEHRLQSEDRAHRIGQTRSVTYVDFITPGTVDERIVEVLRKKKKMSDLIMDRPLKEWI